jgi:hypothetical protein
MKVTVVHLVLKTLTMDLEFIFKPVFVFFFLDK